ESTESPNLAVSAGAVLQNGFAVHLNRAELNPSAGAMAAARHQVGKADLVYAGEIRIGRPDFLVRIRSRRTAVHRDHSLRIELDPADVPKREFTERQLGHRSDGKISHQQGAIRKFHHGTNHM